MQMLQFGMTSSGHFGYRVTARKGSVCGAHDRAAAQCALSPLAPLRGEVMPAAGRRLRVTARDLCGMAAVIRGAARAGQAGYENGHTRAGRTSWDRPSAWAG
jgi:hypothetical protein